MNLVVRVDGTAELDDRALRDVAPTALLAKTWLTIPLTVDGDQVGQALCLPVSPGSHAARNTVAQALVADITGLHIWFVGTVVLADLNTDLAHRLLEELTRNGA